jgi:hypothetical protein
MPHILFLQLDGGSENVTKITLLICELLIIKEICDRVLLSYKFLDNCTNTYFFLDYIVSSHGRSHA